MDDYPAELRTVAPDSIGDGRGYQNRECTSFAAWRAHQAGHELTDYGNASNWPYAAFRAGYLVDRSAAPGALALFPANTAGAGRFGHVAVVVAVNGAWLTIEDYNYFGTWQYARHNVPAAGISFLHLPAPPPSPTRDPDMIELARPAGAPTPHAIDLFDVDPAGVGWHTVIDPGGNPGVPFNEPLPGSWSRFLFAEWSADGKTVTVIGRGWSNDAGGQTYYVFWRDGQWNGPVKQP